MYLICREVLKKRLCELNLSMDEFKQQSGVDRRTLERLLSGSTKKPHPSTVKKVSSALDLPHENLFVYEAVADRISTASGLFSEYVTGSPVIHPQHFHGRTEVIKKLTQLWQSMPMQNAAIIGPSGIGKTSLFNYLTTVSDSSYAIAGQQRLQHRANLSSLNWIYLDLSKPTLATPAAIYRELYSQLTNSRTEGDMDEAIFFDLTVDINLQSRTIIILDEIDVSLDRSDMLDNRFWEGMRYLASQHTTHISFLLGSKLSPYQYSSTFGISSPFFNIIGYSSELGPLAVKDANQMLDSSPIPFSEDDKQWVLDQSGYYPRLLQLLCWELLSALGEAPIDGRWRKQAVEKAKHLPEYCIR